MPCVEASESEGDLGGFDSRKGALIFWRPCSEGVESRGNLRDEEVVAAGVIVIVIVVFSLPLGEKSRGMFRSGFCFFFFFPVLLCLFPFPCLS